MALTKRQYISSASALIGSIMFLLIAPLSVSANDEVKQTITVYVDAPFAGKRKKSAEAITESHQKQSEMGFEFEDLEIYVENGDLKGFFVTYMKR